MKNSLFCSEDIRQSKAWGDYMERIHWKNYHVNGINIFVKRVPLIGTFLKIQHPLPPIPFSKIDTLAKKLRALAVIFEPDSYKFRIEDYQKNGYINSTLKFAHSATYRIDLSQSKEKLFKSFSENARRNIKKAKLNDLKTKKINLKNLSDQELEKIFEDFYILIKKLSKDKKFLIDRRWQWWERFQAFKESSIILFAYTNQEPIATVWLSTFNKTIFYMHTGITPAGYQKLANYLLIWEGFLLGKRLGFRIFDFEASYDRRYPKEHPSWKSFTEFKERFHGELIEFPPPQIKFYSKIFKIFYLWTKAFSH